MKVILLRDVPKIGRKYEVRDVADGYAINHLLPNKHAIFATKSAIEKSMTDRERSKAHEERETGEIKTALAALEDSMIEIQEKANDKGHLFASIGEEEIANAILEQKNIRISPNIIDIDKPIKELGERDITLQSGDIRAVFRLNIVSK
jgi:large subunit ribosomal protein L9